MATLDSLIHDILAPVESAARMAPKVLGWLDTPDTESPAAHWDWLDGPAAARGVEITECHLPGDVLRTLFGVVPSPVH